MNNYDKQYLELLQDLLKNGRKSKNRTGIDTYKVWGRQMRIDLKEGFPILTTKKIHWKSVVHELLWFLSGDTNIQYLLKNGVTFWTEWPFQRYNDFNKESELTQKEFEKKIIEDDSFADTWGDIGSLAYGKMWRQYPSPLGGDIDQIKNVIDLLKNDPNSRRIILNAWHPIHTSNNSELFLLSPCHVLYQFATEELTLIERLNYAYKQLSGMNWEFYPNGMTEKDLDEKNVPKYYLNSSLTCRSQDAPLGTPFNQAELALLTHLIAHCVNMIPNTMVWQGADVHYYENQKEGMLEQLKRKPLDLPTLKIKPECPKNIFDIRFEHFELEGYKHLPHISMPVAV